MTRVWFESLWSLKHNLKLQCKKFSRTRDIPNFPTQGWAGTAFCTRKRSETYAFSHILGTLFLLFLTSSSTLKADKNSTLQCTLINFRLNCLKKKFRKLYRTWSRLPHLPRSTPGPLIICQYMVTAQSKTTIPHVPTNVPLQTTFYNITD